MSVTPRLPRKLRSQRGQTIIMFVGLFTIIALVAAIVIDFGVWFSERRGAQKDSDLASLAGAFELLARVDYQNPLDPSVVPPAEAAALAWAAENGVAPEYVHNLIIGTDCFSDDDGIYDSVSLDVEHVSKALFAGIFGVAAPDIGAHARACMGSPSEASGMLPIGVQVVGQDSYCFQDWDSDGVEEPLFGIECKLGFGAGQQVSGETGFLKLYNDGSPNCSAPNSGGGNTVIDEIEAGGAGTTCSVAPPGTTSADCTTGVDYCVWPKTGTVTNPIQGALNDLLDQDGECDAMFGPGLGTADGIDDLLEVVYPVNGDLNAPPGTTTYEARPQCSSPRLIQLIIIDSFSEQGNGPGPIRAFASFFILGCSTDDVDDPYCNQPQGAVGQTELWGIFLNTVNTGAIGPPNEFGQRGIALFE